VGRDGQEALTVNPVDFERQTALLIAEIERALPHMRWADQASPPGHEHDSQCINGHSHDGRWTLTIIRYLQGGFMGYEGVAVLSERLTVVRLPPQLARRAFARATTVPLAGTPAPATSDDDDGDDGP
jgi:hypothetical protein